MEQIRKDPQNREALQGLIEKEDQEGMLRYCAEAAKRLGLDVTEAEIGEAIAEVEWERKKGTEALEQEIQKLSDEETAQVSGGAFWKNEDAPDGHEYDCFITYHGRNWQILQGYSCVSMHLCPSDVIFAPDLAAEHPRCASAYFQAMCKSEFYSK